MRLLSILAVLLMAAAPARAADKVPVIYDTDIGTDIDDAFALGLVLASPELELKGVTSVSADAYGRAMIAARFLNLSGFDNVPVASQKPPQAKPMIEGQFQYGLRPLWRKGPVNESAVDFLYNQLKAEPGKLTLLAVGDLTNVGKLLTEKPDCKPWIKRIVIMGGAVRVGYNLKPPPEPEWNIKSDIKNAQVVFSAGVPLVVAPLDATTHLHLDGPMRQKIFAANTPITNQLRQLYDLWGKETPTLFDPVAVMLCFDESLCTMEDLCLEVDDKGLTKEIKGGKPNARVATSIKKDDFLKWYVNRLAGTTAPSQAKDEPKNVSTSIARTGMPARVHAFEDYESDVERRWWLAGKLETKNVPPGSTRACRGALTVDFDRRKENANHLYNAVIFNPVPGPPMGPNTRLTFKYWLKGTSDLRVQLYTLSKGYHRHLTLTGLPQEKWQELTVDMTQMRRPDGSGGPLAEDERIDDIQFYADPSAELLIDDIVLYEAAAKDEQRPFPQRLVFTGGFDTGAQGKEWPGDFEIVAKEKPLTWKAAKSVVHPDTKVPYVRVSLRGARPLGDNTHLTFKYRLTDADSMKVSLVNKTEKLMHQLELKELKKGEWATAFVDFGTATAKPRNKGWDKVEEIYFELPKGAELLLDDLLLYGPGKAQ